MIKKLFLVTLMLLSVYIAKAQDNAPPTLSNFRIENSNKNRVYFDSSEQITASTTSGFTISGKTISSITVNSGAETGHYFTLSSAFTFWDNNTIRYEGGSNLKDTQGNGLLNFTLTHIVNNINEPSTTRDIYVNAKASGSNNGTSESNAFTTLKSAVASISGGGNRILIKAGSYNSENISLPSSGSASSPNVILGYKNTPGDITSNYYNYNPLGGTPSLNANEMPVFTGSSRENSGGTFIEDGSNWIIKNIQVQNYNNGLYFDSAYNIVIDRVNVINIGSTTNKSYEGYGITMYDWVQQAGYFRVKNTFIINSTGSAFYTLGNFSLFENCHAYSNEYDSSQDVLDTTDYYFVSQASNNIFKNCIAWKDTPGGGGHNGHGFSIKSLGSPTYPNQFNLVDDCLAVNILGAFQLRHSTSRFNVIKNSEAHANIPNRTPGSNNTSGIEFLAGNSDNIIENMYIHHVDNGINMVQNSENSTSIIAANDIIRNSVFHNVEQVFRFGTVYGSSSVNNLKFYNNTIGSADNLNWMDGSNISVNMELSNNIIDNVKSLNRSSSMSGQSFTYNNFHSNNSSDWSYTVKSGTGNINLDPKYEGASLGNYRLMPDSPLIDKGKDLTEINFDFEGNARPQGKGYDIGAYEFQDNSTSSINANAGEDVLICAGENIELTATGGTSYTWNTGETTSSITVSPTETTTYSVTVSDGVNSDSDEVIVTVNEAPTVNAGSDASICSGEAVTLTANGIGDFLWSNGDTTSSITVSPTENTTYTVTASNSCGIEVTDDVIVTVTPGINLTVTDDVNVCIGETEITLTANSNGDYLWSTGETTSSITVNPNNTETYTVTSTLGDCSKTDEVTVTVNEAPTVNAGSDASICSGEAVTLTANGIGDFLWSNGDTTSSITVSPTENTTYTVTASNSCGSEATDEVLVIVNKNPTLNVDDDVTIENGSSIVLTASGNGDYLWSTGETTANITVSPTSTTTYSVILTSIEGCTSEKNIVVTVINTETNTVNADAGPDVDICKDESVTLTASGGDSYLWSTGEVTPSITVSPTQTTTYTVTVSNGNAVDVDDVMVYVDEECSGISNRSITQELKVFPNPTNGLLNIELTGYSNELNIDLYSLRGRMIYSENLYDTYTDKVLSRQINLSRYGKGVYFVRITNNGESETKKVLVM